MRERGREGGKEREGAEWRVNKWIVKEDGGTN